MPTITTIEELEAIYGPRPSKQTDPSIVKEVDYHHARIIAR